MLNATSQFVVNKENTLNPSSEIWLSFYMLKGNMPMCMASMA